MTLLVKQLGSYADECIRLLLHLASHYGCDTAEQLECVTTHTHTPVHSIHQAGAFIGVYLSLLPCSPIVRSRHRSVITISMRTDVLTLQRRCVSKQHGALVQGPFCCQGRQGRWTASLRRCQPAICVIEILFICCKRRWNVDGGWRQPEQCSCCCSITVRGSIAVNARDTWKT